MAVYGFVFESGAYMVEEFEFACFASPYGKIDAKRHRRSAGTVREHVVMPVGSD